MTRIIRNLDEFVHDDDDWRRDHPRRTPAEHRADVAQRLSYYDDSETSTWIEELRVQAAWTDEQWEALENEHDALAETARQQKAQRRHEAHRYRLLKDGWPARAVEEAARAELDHPAIKRVIEWGGAPESNVLVLSGVPGCGKTTAAAKWAADVRYRDGHQWSIPFVRASTYARTSRYDKDRDAWLHAQSLVLDDLGAEYADAKGSLQVDFDELFDTFYGNRRPLLVTTNLTAAEFKARYGERIADRLRECGAWFGVAGTSLRGKRD